MKRICFGILPWIMLITSLVGCGSTTNSRGNVSAQDETTADTSVLQEIQLNSDDEFKKSITKDFIEKFAEVDYKTIYNSETDKIVVDYVAPDSMSSFTEEQFGIRYYSVRGIQGSDVGYLVACMEEAAWLLWGEFDIGIRPMVFSGFHYRDGKSNATEHDCLYSFGYRTNVNDDEYGDTYYYDKIAAQSENDVSVSAGASICDSLFGSEKDPKDQRSVYEWQDQQRSLAYDTYAETRLHFNGEPIDLDAQIKQEEDFGWGSSSTENNETFEIVTDSAASEPPTTAPTETPALPPKTDAEKYNDALTLVNTYISCCGSGPYFWNSGRNTNAAQACQAAIFALEECNEYGDSSYWLNTIHSIESICLAAVKANAMIVDGKTGIPHPTLDTFTVDVNESSITLTDNSLYSGDGTKLILTYAADKSSFTANISPVWNDHMKGTDGEAVRMIVALFTESYQDETFQELLLSNSNSDTTEHSFCINYEGYSITIATQTHSDYLTNIAVTGHKL